MTLRLFPPPHVPSSSYSAAARAVRAVVLVADRSCSIVVVVVVAAAAVGTNSVALGLPFACRSQRPHKPALAVVDVAAAAALPAGGA